MLVAQKGSVHISENTYVSVTAYKTESDSNCAETNVMADTVLLFLSEIVCIARTGLLSKEHYKKNSILRK